MQVARDLAVDNGRQELARQMQVKLMGYLERSIQNAVGTGVEEAVGHDYAEGASRTLYKTTLSGTRAVKFDRADSSGEWLALVCLDYEAFEKAAKQLASNAAQKLLQQYQDKHEQLVDKMDQALKEEFPTPPSQSVQ